MSAALRVAIVGAGPSGLYAAAELLKRHASAQVEMFDRLPCIGGLVRSGVSPDHAARRKVTDTYEQLLAASGRFRFHGHVEMGRDLSHEELRAHHHAVIYASGAASDKHLDIPGEQLAGCHAATAFVGWYNGHPDFADCSFDLSCERAVVIGNGNVALDVARLLLMSPAALSQTDIADHALDALRESRVKEVVILGRRGPAQAAFTFPELLELAALDDVDVVVECPPALLAAQQQVANPLRLELLREYATANGLGSESRSKRLVLRFLSSPVEVLGAERVQALRIVRNELLTQADGGVRAQPVGTPEDLSCGLVLRAVGYRAAALPGLPFDAKAGVLPNAQGRVLDHASGTALKGTYVAGWLKRGPSGVIGTNKRCSQETVNALLQDAANGLLNHSRESGNPAHQNRDEIDPAPSQMTDITELLASRGVELVDYAGWKRIDRAERKRGAAQARPRVKWVHRQDLLLAAR